MTLPANDDFSNRELSVDELDAIAAGGFFGSILHGIEHAASAAVHFVEREAPVVARWIEKTISHSGGQKIPPYL